MEDDPALLPLLLVEDGAGELGHCWLYAVLRAVTRRRYLHPSHFLETENIVKLRVISQPQLTRYQ